MPHLERANFLTRTRCDTYSSVRRPHCCGFSGFLSVLCRLAVGMTYDSMMFTSFRRLVSSARDGAGRSNL
jgi:hypothetical protein